MEGSNSGKPFLWSLHSQHFLSHRFGATRGRCYMTDTIRKTCKPSTRLREIRCKNLNQFKIRLEVRIRWVREPLHSGTEIGVLTRMHAAEDHQPTSPVSWIEKKKKKNTFPETPGLFCGDSLKRTRSIWLLLPRNTYPRNARSGCCSHTPSSPAALTVGIFIAPYLE